jgi:PAS domain S-box-containing protein
MAAMVTFSADNQTDQRFRLIVEAAPIALVLVDHDGKIVLVNTQTEALFGYRRDELLGQPIEILAPKSYRKSHASLRSDYFSQPQARPMGSRKELFAQHKDGKRFPVEVGLTPIPTEQGTFVLGAILDIGERKRAENNFRLAVEAAPAAIVMLDNEGRIVLVNAQTEVLFGYNRDELLGQPIEILVPGSCPKSRPDQHQARRLRIKRDLFGLRKDGKQFQVEIELTPIETERGKWVLCSIADITFDRQKLESIGELAGGIAHDFNNLLGSILADADLALTQLSADSLVVEEISRIRKVAIRASEIVRELMTYAGKEQAKCELVDLSQLVEEMADLLKVSTSKRAVLKTRLGRRLPSVWVNATQISQVLMNLIINASEAITETNGTITVTTSCVTGGSELAPHSDMKLPFGDYLCLEVSDTGCGITEQEKDKIFNPYFTTKFAGRGLGLAVVQGIVRAHRGALNLVSVLGKGTTFQVLLPCAGRPVHGNRARRTPASSDRVEAVSGTVLLVEDEESLRLPVAKILRRSGFAVIEAADGSAAIELFERGKAQIDVILLDVTIPGASSREVLEEAKRTRPDIKVVLTSAYSPEMVAFPLNTPHVAGFIRKPFELKTLLELLRDVLAADNALS